MLRLLRAAVNQAVLAVAAAFESDPEKAGNLPVAQGAVRKPNNVTEPQPEPAESKEGTAAKQPVKTEIVHDDNDDATLVESIPPDGVRRKYLLDYNMPYFGLRPKDRDHLRELLGKFFNQVSPEGQAESEEALFTEEEYADMFANEIERAKRHPGFDMFRKYMLMEVGADENIVENFGDDAISDSFEDLCDWGSWLAFSKYMSIDQWQLQTYFKYDDPTFGLMVKVLPENLDKAIYQQLSNLQILGELRRAQAHPLFPQFKECFLYPETFGMLHTSGWDLSRWMKWLAPHLEKANDAEMATESASHDAPPNNDPAAGTSPADIDMKTKQDVAPTDMTDMEKIEKTKANDETGHSLADGEKENTKANDETGPSPVDMEKTKANDETGASFANGEKKNTKADDEILTSSATPGDDKANASDAVPAENAATTMFPNGDSGLSSAVGERDVGLEGKAINVPAAADTAGLEETPALDPLPAAVAGIAGPAVDQENADVASAAHDKEKEKDDKTHGPESGDVSTSAPDATLNAEVRVPETTEGHIHEVAMDSKKGDDKDKTLEVGKLTQPRLTGFGNLIQVSLQTSLKKPDPVEESQVPASTANADESEFKDKASSVKDHDPEKHDKAKESKKAKKEKEKDKKEKKHKKDKDKDKNEAEGHNDTDELSRKGRKRAADDDDSCQVPNVQAKAKAKAKAKGKALATPSPKGKGKSRGRPAKAAAKE